MARREAAAAKRREWSVLVPDVRVGRRGEAIARIWIVDERIEGTDAESDGEEGGDQDQLH